MAVHSHSPAGWKSWLLKTLEQSSSQVEQRASAWLGRFNSPNPDTAALPIADRLVPFESWRTFQHHQANPAPPTGIGWDILFNP